MAMYLPLTLGLLNPARSYLFGAMAYMASKLQSGLIFIRCRAASIIAVQCAVYIFAYDALLPEGMYFSPDSILYLSVSDIIPPTFSLFSRGLVELELALGSTRIVFLRYVVVALYCAGGILISRALIRSKKSVLAVLILPALWSMSSLTQWFNYFLTDGIATAFLIISIGAYANLHISIEEKDKENGSENRWLVLFVLFGMLAFSMRPAFAFVGPAMIVMTLSRTIFSRRRFVAVSVGVALLATAHFSFSIYWHGHIQSQLGGVLTALVFDFPLPDTCRDKDQTEVCNVQRALTPFVHESLGKGSYYDRFIYKARNNIKTVTAARSAIKSGDSNAILTEIALKKIRFSPIDYIFMVLGNAYYSVKAWGDWAWYDSLGSVAKVNISNTNAVAPAVSKVVKKVAGIDFDPTIETAPAERFYKDYIFQLPRLIINKKFIKKYTILILCAAIFFGLFPFFFPVSVPGLIVFSCCIFGVSGTIFQNAFFPVIPRLLDPFYPLGALSALMIVSILFKKIQFIFTTKSYKELTLPKLVRAIPGLASRFS